jgi:hypothetical protein
MLISFLAVLIIYLVIIGYISSQSSNTVGNLKMSEMAAKSKFSQEKILLNSVSLYIEKTGTVPASVQALKDNDYLNSNFVVGSYVFNVANNNTTLVICSNHDINTEIYKNFYLKHYTGKELGYHPYVDGTTRDICHPFPLRSKTIDVLN